MEWMPKTLFDAMLVLARTHTRDDDQVGFTLQSAPILWEQTEYSREHYLKAWEIVREQLSMSARPQGSLKAAEE